MKNYSEALQEELPQNVRVVLERQLAGVQRNHDQVKQMRDSARADLNGARAQLIALLRKVNSSFN